MEEKDLHYLGVLSTRKRSVAQLHIMVEAASDDAGDIRNADLARDVIERDSLEDELIDLLDAIGKGWSVCEIVWDLSGRHWIPQRIEYRLPEWFAFDRERPTQLMLRTNQGPQPLAPYKYICHFAKAKSGLPVRGGLARPVAWFWLFKNLTLKDWVIFAEVYGQPLRVGTYPVNASETDRDTLLRAVAQIGTDAAAIIPEGMLIEFIKAEGGGSSTGDVYLKLCDYLDQQVSKAVLGQVATTDAIAGGHAVGRVHRQVQEDITRADARQLAATLNRDLVRPLIDLNFGLQPRYPTLRIGRPDDMPLETLTEALARLVPLGLKVGMSTVRDKLGLPDPEAGEDLLQPTATLPPVMPGDTLPDRDSGPAQAGSAADGIAGHAATEATPDAIEALVAEMLAHDGWRQAVAPQVADVTAALATAPDLATVRDRLAALVQRLDDTRLREMIARAGFAARIAGEVDATLADASEDG